jgi:hypothetical protein
MKVWVIRVFRVPDCDNRITRNNFGFCKLLPEIPEQNSGFGYFGFGFGFRVTGFFAQPYWPPITLYGCVRATSFHPSRTLLLLKMLMDTRDPIPDRYLLH